MGGGTNLDAVSWKTTSYNDAAWVSRKSAFGFGSVPAKNTTLPIRGFMLVEDSIKNCKNAVGMI